MSDSSETATAVESEFKRVQRGLEVFAEDMRAQGIHVGLGSPGRCVTCGQASPCSGSAAS